MCRKVQNIVSAPRVRSVLCIAGSDCSAGAGIQADIKTCALFGVHATTAITAITAQTFSRVLNVDLISPSLIRRQIEAAAEAIRPVAVKIGMLGSAEIVSIVADTLQNLGLTANIVCDPVMVSTSGNSLCRNSEKFINALEDQLFPLCTIVTPNIPEAKVFLNCSGRLDSFSAAKTLLKKWRCRGVVLKGGHDGKADICQDILCCNNEITTYSHKRISSKNTHGTGCTFSSAVASLLASGMSVQESVAYAGDFMETLIRNSAGYEYSLQGGTLGLFHEAIRNNNFTQNETESK